MNHVVEPHLHNFIRGTIRKLPIFISSACVLQGLIDVTKEVAKLDDKRNKLNAQLKKLFETINGADYVTKVPENVRNQNSDKVICLSSSKFDLHRFDQI